MASRGATLRGALAIPGAARPTPAPQGSNWASALNGGRGLNAPSIGQTSPLAAQLANESGYASAYGPFLARPTQTFTQGAFGPFSPILPVPVDSPENGLDRPEARRFQYQVGWNLPVGQPGTEAGMRLCSFDTMTKLADGYSIARACVEYRKNQLRGIAWDITPTPDAQKAYQNNPAKMADFGKRRAQAMKFFNRPDSNYLSFASWISNVIEEVLVYDALSLQLIPPRVKNKGILGSSLTSFMTIHGPTIRPLLDLHGGTPHPPAPGYQQYLYGVPRSDLMSVILGTDIDDAGLTGAEVASFCGDQLMYVPMIPRAWTPYGLSAIERAIIPIYTGLQKQGVQYDWFSEGTVPAAYVIPGDTAMTPNQLRELQDALNAIAGDPAWKQKIIVLPPGSHIEPQRQMTPADEMDQWLTQEVCMAFGLTPMEIGVTPGRSSSSSGGAQNQMAKMTQDRGEDTGVTPWLLFLSDIFNLIITQVFQQQDMLFTFEGLQQEEDQDALTGVLVQQFQNGMRTLDECRQELNLQPYGMQETSEPLLVTPNGVMPISTAVQSAVNAANQQAASNEQQAGAAQAQAGQAQAQTANTQAQTAHQLSQTQIAQEAHDVAMHTPPPGQTAAQAALTEANAQNVRARTASTQSQSQMAQEAHDVKMNEPQPDVGAQAAQARANAENTQARTEQVRTQTQNSNTQAQRDQEAHDVKLQEPGPDQAAQAAQTRANTASTNARTAQTHAQTQQTQSQTQISQESHEADMNTPPPQPSPAAGAEGRQEARAQKSVDDLVVRKRADAEFNALARHLGKGRPVSTWDARFISQGSLADVARGMAEGLDPHSAVAVARVRAVRAVQLPASEYEWVEKVGLEGYEHGWKYVGHDTLTGDDAHEHVTDVSKQDIPWEHRRAVREYTGSKYDRMNNYRRTGTDAVLRVPSVDGLMEHVAASELSRSLRDAISNTLPTSSPIMLHRGINDANNAFGAVGSMIGNVFTDRGFISTTTSRTSAVPMSNSGAVMHIHIPRETRALNPGTISALPGENEVILDGLTGEITGDDVVNGVRHVNIEAA